MSGADAAYRVLEDVGEPLHYKEITERMLRRKLWRTSGKTPATTINRDISEEINNPGKDSRFCRVGLGMYAISTPATMLLKSILGKNCGLALHGTLVEWPSAGFRSGTKVKVRADLACVIAAWCRLPEKSKQEILKIIKNEFQKERSTG